MDMGGGLAIGIAIGTASGIASGMAAGQSRTRKHLQQHIEQHGITVHDRFGKPVKTADFLDEACGAQTPCCSRGTMWALVIAGLAALAVLAGGLLLLN
jgi:hypothetical protein